MPPSSLQPIPTGALPGPTSRDRRGAAWLLVAVSGLYLLTASGRPHTIDEYEAYFAAESLAERGTTSLPPEKGFFGRRGHDGRFWAPYGPLLPVVAAPGSVVGREIGQAFGLPPHAVETLTWTTTTATNAVVAALGVVALFLLAREMGAPRRGALAAAAILAIATPHWHYATTFFSEPLSALLVLLAAWALARYRRVHGRELRPLPLLLAALPLALTVGVRMAMAILFPPLAVAVFCLVGRTPRKRLAAAAVYCALPIVAVSLYLLWNVARFGDPLQPGYPDTFEGSEAPLGFGEPLARGLYGLLASPGKGLFLFAMPVLCAGALASRWARRGGALAVALLLLPLVPLIFYAKYSHWEGGYCWGPRYLLPTLALWLLPLALLGSSRAPLRAAVVTSSLVAGAIQALGVSVSFVECQVTRGYYREGFVYNLGYSAVAETGGTFLFHAGEALRRGHVRSETEGLGFDRWFLHLARAGIDGWILTLVVAGLALAFLVGAVSAHRLLGRREAPRTTEAPETSEVRSPGPTEPVAV